MKYTVNGYSQEKCIELGLDYVDTGILRWIQDFYPKMTKKIFNGKEYGWINYSHFLEDMPILGINKPDSLYRRLQKLIKAGLIERECHKSINGSFSYCRITNKITTLIKIPTGTDQNPDGGTDQNPDQNNPSTKYILLLKIHKRKNLPTELFNLIQEWLDYKSARKESYKTEASIEKFITRLLKLANNDIKTAIDIVDQAMANNWAGVFELKNIKKQEGGLF